MTKPTPPHRHTAPEAAAPARGDVAGGRRRTGPVAVAALVVCTALAAGYAGHTAFRRSPGTPTPPPRTLPSPGHPAWPGAPAPAVPATASTAGEPGASSARPVYRLADNPLNTPGLGLPAVHCALPHFDSSPAGQNAFYQAALPCLNNAWRPVLRAAGLPFRAPRVVTVTHEVTTPCGVRRSMDTALYCDGVIYMTPRYYRDYEHHGDDAGVYLGQLAHEYGHHVQELAGIMETSWLERRRVGSDTPAGHDRSRRIELQATCYEGMFQAAAAGRDSVAPSMVRSALADAGSRGDYPDGRAPDHGAPHVNADWVRRGYTANRTDSCNTWSASASGVA